MAVLLVALVALGACGPTPAPQPAPPPASASLPATKWTRIGAVDLPSKACLAIDPGYEDDPELGVRIELPRTDWEAWYGVLADEPGRVAQLALVRPGSSPDGAPGEAYGSDLEIVGVDSGQAGFFDPAHAWKDDEAVAPFADLKTDGLSRWYLMCCARTLGTPGAGLVPHGVVSSSGWGDGGYEVFVRRDAKKEIEVVRVEFISPDDE